MNNKEILTNECIAKDILSRIFSTLIGDGVAFLLLYFFSLLFKFLSSASGNERFVELVFYVHIILAFCALLDLVYQLRIIIKAKKYDFIMLNDFVTDKKEYVQPSMFIFSIPFGFLLTTPYTLYFGNYGKYVISKRIINYRWSFINSDNYKWSKYNKMSDKSLYNSSCIGDDFLLVSLNGKHIHMVYNMKFFDYSNQ